MTEGGPAASVTATLTLSTSGSGPAQLAVPVIVTLPGNADYTTTAATFSIGSVSGATANIGVMAVDDNLGEQPIESFPGVKAQVNFIGGNVVTIGASSGTQQIDVHDNDPESAIISMSAQIGATYSADGTTIINPSGATFDGTPHIYRVDGFRHFDRQHSRRVVWCDDFQFNSQWGVPGATPLIA